MDAAQLRPLSIGEILDVAIKIYQARFAHLVMAVAVVVGPVSLVGALIQASAAPDTDEFLTTTDTAVGSSVDFGDFWGLAAGFLLSALLGFIAAEIATAASFKLVSGAYLDTDPDWRESLRFATSRLRSLVWLSIVSGVLMGLAFLACIVPGVYFYGAWAVAVPVLLLEEHRGRRALKRSRELVTGRWWPTVVAIVVATILGSIVSGIFSGILLAALLVGDNALVEAIGQAVATTAASVLTTPFTAAVIAVLYFDLRVRKEGFDLELLARRVGVEPPAGGPPGILPPSGEPPQGEPPFWPPPPGWRPPDA